CDCDSRFRRCLLDLNDTISNLIGVTFFDLLEVPCFVLEPSEACVQWHWWGGCQRYGMVPLARMVQPHQYHAGPLSPLEEEGTNGATRQPLREGRGQPPRLGHKQLRQRLGQNPQLRQVPSAGQKQRLVVPPQQGAEAPTPASPSGEAEPTTGSLSAARPPAAVAMREQDSEGRQELGAAREGGHGQPCRCFKRLDKCEQQVAPRELKYTLHNADTRTLFHCNCTRSCVATVQALLVPAWHLRSALRHWGSLPAGALAKQQAQTMEDSGGTLYQRCLQLASEQRGGARLPTAPR
ncbi:PREDICTED: group 3 secretory phospholipase A2, partial [Tinamus guttatus]